MSTEMRPDDAFFLRYAETPAGEVEVELRRLPAGSAAPGVDWVPVRPLSGQERALCMARLIADQMEALVEGFNVSPTIGERRGQELRGRLARLARIVADQATETARRSNRAYRELRGGGDEQRRAGRPRGTA